MILNALFVRVLLSRILETFVIKSFMLSWQIIVIMARVFDKILILLH